MGLTYNDVKFEIQLKKIQKSQSVELSHKGTKTELC